MLEDRVAFVTGSTRGIGWATAQTLAGAGAAVILNGRSDPQALEARVAELNRAGGPEASGILCDVSDPSAVSACYQEIYRRHKRLDVLVNNAGVLQDALLGMIPTEAVQRI